MATPAIANLTSGPAKVTLAATEIGHTSGGIGFTMTPANRARTVDQYGSSEISFVHTGDSSRMTVPWCEWTASVIAEIYEPGNNQTAATTAYMGLGRTSGYIYTTQAAQIIPRLTADAGKLIDLWAVTPIGEFTLMHNSDEDRIFETEFACVISESKTDGELIGQVEL